MFSNFSYDPVTNRHAFDIRGVDLAVVNGLRRTLLSSVPILAFDGSEADPSVQVLRNTGPLHNQILIHRLGLVPLHLDENAIETFRPGDLEFELQKRNDEAAALNVTARDFEGTLRGEALSREALDRIFPVHPVSGDAVLITRLRSGEELHVRARPVLATAKKHAGFMPVSLSTFSFLPDPTADLGRKPSPLARERAFARDEFGDPLGARFQLEPLTGLPPRYLVGRALEIVLDKLLVARTELFRPDSARVRLEIAARSADLALEGEDDTLGALIQSRMHSRSVRAGDGSVAYVGYFAPHPLQERVVVRAALQPGATPEAYRALFADGIEAVVDELRGVLEAWRAAAPP